MSRDLADPAWFLIACCEPIVTGRSRFDDAVPNRVAHELAHRVEIKFGQDLCAVCFGGLVGPPEGPAYFLIGLPLGEELQHFALARRQSSFGPASARGRALRSGSASGS